MMNVTTKMVLGTTATDAHDTWGVRASDERRLSFSWGTSCLILCSIKLQDDNV